MHLFTTGFANLKCLLIMFADIVSIPATLIYILFTYLFNHTSTL
jgi:hypothetical protein